MVLPCSLSHGATPATEGIRYATLPFLHDDASARIREANEATGGAATAGRATAAP